VFAVCATLYEAFYGQRPFAGESPEAILLATLHGKVQPPPRRDDVPSHVRAIVLEGLAADPAARPASMGALGEALSTEHAVARSAGSDGAALEIGGILAWLRRVFLAVLERLVRR
jgi:hypothetical protein